MYSTPDPFINAEVNYRREQIRAQYAGHAQRRSARRSRRLPVARRAAGHLPGRLVTGS